MLRIIKVAIRWTLTLLLVSAIYNETGPWTALGFFLLAIHTEAGHK